MTTWNFRIGRPWPGETRDQTAERLAADDQPEEAPDPAEIRRLRGLLERAAPALVMQEAPKGWTLTHPGSGSQIRMSGDEFSMTVPRMFSPSMGRSLWTDLWPAITAISNEGYCVYAPPLNRAIDPESDLEPIVTAYAGAAAKPSATPPPPPRKPWWQFWR